MVQGNRFFCATSSKIISHELSPLPSSAFRLIVQNRLSGHQARVCGSLFVVSGIAEDTSVVVVPTALCLILHCPFACLCPKLGILGLTWCVRSAYLCFA